MKPSNSDRKSTRLNSSHLGISYAVFCLKKQVPSAHHEAGRLIREAGRRDAHIPFGDRLFFFLMIRRPPRSTLFPYTTALSISWSSKFRQNGARFEELPRHLPGVEHVDHVSLGFESAQSLQHCSTIHEPHWVPYRFSGMDRDMRAVLPQPRMQTRYAGSNGFQDIGRRAERITAAQNDFTKASPAIVQVVEDSVDILDRHHGLMCVLLLEIAEAAQAGACGGQPD